MIFKKIAQTILLLFVCNISNADSLSIFGGKSMDSNLIDFPKKAAEGNLDIERYKIFALAYQQSIKPPSVFKKLNTNIEYIYTRHSPDHVSETALAYNVTSPSFNILSTNVRLGVSVGLSYVYGEPTFEDGTKNEPNKKYRLLNYNAYEISLLDDNEQSSIFLRIHHRSGAYGLIAPQHVGSNFITAGLRYYF